MRGPITHLQGTYEGPMIRFTIAWVVIVLLACYSVSKANVSYSESTSGDLKGKVDPNVSSDLSNSTTLGLLGLGSNTVVGSFASSTTSAPDTADWFVVTLPAQSSLQLQLTISNYIGPPSESSVIYSASQLGGAIQQRSGSFGQSGSIAELQMAHSRLR